MAIPGWHRIFTMLHGISYRGKWKQVVCFLVGIFTRLNQRFHERDGYVLLILSLCIML